MSDLTLQLPGLAWVLGALLAGPGAAVAFLLWQKKRRQALRRSAFDRKMLRSPGHSLRERLEAARLDVVWSVLWLAMWPLLMLSLYLVQVQATPGVAQWWEVYVSLAAGFVAVQIFRLTRLGKTLDDLRAGYDAEVAAGQELDQLMSEGARVFHDLPGEGFHIGHVVVSSEGLFAIETRGYAKPRRIKHRAATVTFDGSSLRFPTWSTVAPLEQAHMQAQWLARWCAAMINEPISAAPVLSLPGWYIDRVGPGPVRVVSGRELRTLLHVDVPAHLAPELVERIAHLIEQRCRDVAATAQRGETRVAEQP